jgi:hypothetical protein
LQLRENPGAQIIDGEQLRTGQRQPPESELHDQQAKGREPIG